MLKVIEHIAVNFARFEFFAWLIFLQQQFAFIESQHLLLL